jgi:hypothetical protein
MRLRGPVVSGKPYDWADELPDIEVVFDPLCPPGKMFAIPAHVGDKPSQVIAELDRLIAEAKAEMQWNYQLDARELLFGVAIGPIAPPNREPGGLAAILTAHGSFSLTGQRPAWSLAPPDVDAIEVSGPPLPAGRDDDPLDSDGQTRLEPLTRHDNPRNWYVDSAPVQTIESYFESW